MDTNSLEVYFNNKDKFTKNALIIYNELVKTPDCSAEQLCKLLNMKDTSVRPRLTELKNLGVIKVSGKIKNANNNNTNTFRVCVRMETHKKTNLKSLFNQLDKLSRDELSQVFDYILKLNRK